MSSVPSPGPRLLVPRLPRRPLPPGVDRFGSSGLPARPAVLRAPFRLPMVIRIPPLPAGTRLPVRPRLGPPWQECGRTPLKLNPIQVAQALSLPPPGILPTLTAPFVIQLLPRRLASLPPKQAPSWWTALLLPS